MLGVAALPYKDNDLHFTSWVMRKKLGEKMGSSINNTDFRIKWKKSAIYCKYREPYVEKKIIIITWEGEVKVKRRSKVNSKFHPEANILPFLVCYWISVHAF